MDDLRVTKSWANFHFWVNYPFNFVDANLLENLHFCKSLKFTVCILRVMTVMADGKCFYVFTSCCIYINIFKVYLYEYT